MQATFFLLSDFLLPNFAIVQTLWLDEHHLRKKHDRIIEKYE